MNTITKSFLLVSLLSLSPCFSAFAEPPFLVTESAIPIDKQSYRMDGGLQYNKASTDITILSAALRYGLINNLEVVATLPYLFANNKDRSDSQFGDVLLGAKVRFIKGREANPLSIGGAMQVKLPFGSTNDLFETTGKADVGFVALASKEIPPYEAHLNIGYTLVGKDASDRRSYAIGVDYKEFRENLSLMGELFGTTNNSGPSHDNWSGAIGAYSFVRSDIRLDTALAIGLSHYAPDYTFNLRGSYFFN